MKSDPPLREDGNCRTCGKARRSTRGVSGKKPMRETSLHHRKAQAELDPFCSTECAKVYYGVNFQAARTTS